MTVLYLTEPGSTLAASSRTLVVRHGGQERAQVPALGLERVMVLAPSHLTSAAVALCAQEQVELVVVAHGARVMARLGASEAGLATHAAQHRRAAEAEFCLEFARTIVRGKVRNQRRVLGRSGAAAEPAVAFARVEMQALLERAAAVETVASLRGVEGRASAVYFRALRALVNPEFGFRGRNQRPPRDPANAMLSFAYTLLTAEAAAAVCGAGLEPALGFYHGARGGRPALALDLVEEFRAPVADALLLQLTGWRAVRPSQFRETDRGMRMNSAARRRFLQGYEAKLAQPFAGPVGEETTLRRALRAQAARLARAVRNEEAYASFELP
jgi:CRISPR-associated protein Cas1